MAPQPLYPLRSLSLSALTMVVVVVGMGSGCHSLTLSGARLPSNDRDWRPELATLPTAELDGDHVMLHNIRNCSYFSEDIYTLDHYDDAFDLSQLRGVDYVVVPFKTAPGLAHTMLSFEFGDGEKSKHVAVSVEARLEKGEAYSPVDGAAKQFELMYVVATERDVLSLRTEQRDVDVYVYRVNASPERVRSLFLDVLKRVNELADKPEFYDTFKNNCTNNIVRHINKLRPGRVPWDIRVLLPSLSDQLAYDLGLLDTTKPFSELKREARINEAAHAAINQADFSSAIRR